METNITLPKEFIQKLEELFIVLSEKEKNIIHQRFALQTKRQETLSEIGKKYNVTRERIRQIEVGAISKLRRHVVHTPIQHINKIGKKIILAHHGIIEEKKLFHLMTKQLPFQPDPHYLRLSLKLDPELKRTGNTAEFAPHWKIRTISKTLLQEIATAYQEILTNKGKTIEINEICNILTKTIKANAYINSGFLQELFSIDKCIKKTGEKIGLTSWAHINPRTIRQKIFFILRKNKKPLHFSEMTKQIEEKHFDTKRTNIYTVHNELIRNSSFIHVGRGIYALEEWGYYSGSVAEVMEGILKKSKKPLDRDTIIEETQKQRRVKKITIILNLKNKPQFQRVGRNHYTV